MSVEQLPAPSVDTTKTASNSGAELTPTQVWARRVFESNEQNPYLDRGMTWGSFFKEAGDAASTLITNPRKFFTEYKEIDKKLRGGRDLGGLKDRAERTGVFAGIFVGAVALDKVVSMRNLNKLFAHRADWNTRELNPKFTGEKGDKEMKYKWFSIPVRDKKGKHQDAPIGKGLASLFDVFADKYVVNGLNYQIQNLTGDKNFVAELSEQIGDFSNVVVKDSKPDLINGTALEMVVRILSQIPMAGALVEVPYAKLNKAIVSNAVTKLTGKAGAIGLGVIAKALWDARNGEGASGAMNRADIEANAA